MSRRGGGTVFEEHDTYIREEAPRRPPAHVRERERPQEYEEHEFIRRETTRESDRRPDFLRDDYDRPTGELVRIEREETFSRPLERRPRSPSPVSYRERVIETTQPAVERVRTRLVERERERSPSPPGQLRARVIETRERIPMRERSPSPIRYRERFIERERERSPSPARSEHVRITETREEIRRPPPSPSRSPSPPPFIRAPPIHQEIITHHRHIDHGYEIQARVPTPPPPPRRPSPPRVRETDIDIHTSRNNTEVDIHTKNRTRRGRSTSRGRDFYDDSVLYDHDHLKVSDNQLTITRRRSVSARPSRKPATVDIRDTESEADYYARKLNERAYIGEAYNGATKDWAIVDVPPGTERVKMDGVGGGSQEITWQRFNGVRRSKFIPQKEEPKKEKAPEPKKEGGGLEIDIHTSSRRRKNGVVYEREREYQRVEAGGDMRVGFPRGPSSRAGDLWTEITKDLVVAEAIQQLGYDYEETEFFFYVLQYLRYEDVLQIVQVSEQIRRERQARLQEIERERARIERKEWERAQRRRAKALALANAQYDDERIIEREIIYDRSRPRRSGGGW